MSIKMQRRIKYIFGILGILFFLTGCVETIHEYPTEPSIKLDLTCEINNEDIGDNFFVTVECEGKGTSYIVRTQGETPGNTRFDEPVILRYVYDLYRVVASHSEFVERKVVWADLSQPVPEAVQFDLAAAEYNILVWCDYVYESSKEESLYYNINDLRNIRYSDIEVKDNNDKDVFTNMLHVNLREYSDSLEDHEISKHIVRERPKGRYKC